MVQPNDRRNIRSRRGSAISEFGPALFMVLIFGLLPVIDGVAIGLNYASTYYLNELQLREAQKLPKSQAVDPKGAVVNTIPTGWRTSLLGGMAQQGSDITSVIDYQPVPWKPVGANQELNFWFVTVRTTVSFRPMLTIPFLKMIPGLGAPITVTVAGRRPVENNRFLNQ